MLAIQRSGGFGAVRSRQRRRVHQGFGDIPNDFEASVDLQYIPVRQAWYYGYPVDGSGYPDTPNGLGQATATPPDANAAALAQLAKSERLQTMFQVVSTLSIATLATLAIARAIRAARHGNSDRPFLGDDDED